MKSFFQDLNRRMAALAAVIVVAVTVISQMLLMHNVRETLATRLNEKAVFINTFYAFLIADSLQRKDDVTLLQIINRLEEDREIVSVIVVDGNGDVRYHSDPEKIGTKWDDRLITTALQTGDATLKPFKNSGGDAVALVAPLKVPGQTRPIGAVRMDLTYRHIDQQISNFAMSYVMTVLALAGAAVALMIFCVQRWIVAPLQNLGKSLAALSPTTADMTLPETSDEFGKINKAVNDLMTRFRAEMQHQGAQTSIQAEQERYLLENLTRSFLPGYRIIIADKDNRVLSDSGNGAHPGVSGQVHLLDLIIDTNFANLVGDAFRREGEAVRGPVQFEDGTYEATIFRIPQDQSVQVKTLIALHPNKESL